jgi:hypothetical protein
MSAVRAYNSPLREEKSRETREAILASLFSLMQSVVMPDETGMEAIAQEAGVPLRRVPPLCQQGRVVRRLLAMAQSTHWRFDRAEDNAGHH